MLRRRGGVDIRVGREVLESWREGGNDVQGGKAGIWDREGMMFFGDGGVGGRGERGAEREMGKAGGGADFQTWQGWDEEREDRMGKERMGRNGME